MLLLAGSLDVRAAGVALPVWLSVAAVAATIWEYATVRSAAGVARDGVSAGGGRDFRIVQGGVRLRWPERCRGVPNMEVCVVSVSAVVCYVADQALPRKRSGRDRLLSTLFAA